MKNKRKECDSYIPEEDLLLYAGLTTLPLGDFELREFVGALDFYGRDECEIIETIEKHLEDCDYCREIVGEHTIKMTEIMNREEDGEEGPPIIYQYFIPEKFILH